MLIQNPFENGIVKILWLLITKHTASWSNGGKRLVDVLPADSHARYAVQRAKYTDDPTKWERFRPLVAAAFLEQAAFHKVSLSTHLDLGAAVRKLAEKHDVPVEEIKIAGVGDVIEAMKTLPAATENACVAASLVTIESDLPRLVDRAEAWANGNVERIENGVEPRCLRLAVRRWMKGSVRRSSLRAYAAPGSPPSRSICTRAGSPWPW